MDQPTGVKSGPKLKGAVRRSVNLSELSEVTLSQLNADSPLPLMISAEAAGIEAEEWAGANRDMIQSKLLVHGGILFRGFHIDSPAKFESFAAAVCTELFQEYGDLPRESAGGKVYSSTPYPNDKPILFHNESSHMHRWPMKIIFCCLQAAPVGGETPIVDCRRIYQQLRPETRDRLLRKKLMYVRNFTDGLDVSWQSFFQTDNKAAIEAYCREAGIDFEWKPENRLRTRQVCPAIVKHPQTGEMVFFNQIQLHHIAYLDAEVRASLLSLMREEDLPRNVYYGDGSPIESSTIEEINELYDKNAVVNGWEPGDVVMLNNMLVAHSRKPFEGPRKIVVALGELVYQKDLPPVNA
jgi:alpha-ketoglutarate-dependent taurine dioxygenase